MCKFRVVELKGDRLEFAYRLHELGILDIKKMMQGMMDDIRRATGLPKKVVKGDAEVVVEVDALIKEMKGGDGD